MQTNVQLGSKSVVAWGWGRKRGMNEGPGLCTGTRKLSGMTNMLTTLILMTILQVYTYVKTYQVVYLK